MKLVDQSAQTNWKFIAIVAIVTLLLGGGVWWYGKMLTEVDLAQEQKYVRDSTREDEQENETAGWQTYRNDEFGFEVRYPAGWRADEGLPRGSTESGTILQGDEAQKVSFLETNPGLWQGSIEISVLKNPKKLSLEQWAKQYFRPLGVDPTVNLAHIVGDAIFGEKPAKKFSVFAFDSNETVIATIHNNYVYHIEFTGETPNDPDMEEHQKIYDQILSTFRFIE